MIINKVYVLDTETTGVENNPKTGSPDIIELAHICLTGHIGDIRSFINFSPSVRVQSVLMIAMSDQAYSERFKPDLSINQKAYEIHGIRFIDVLKARHHSKAVEELPEMEYMLAHNAVFDYRCIGKPKGIKLVCTKKLATRVKKFNLDSFPDAQLDTLVKHYYPEFTNELIQDKHSALTDCIKTILVFCSLLDKLPGLKTWEEVHQFCEAKV